MATVKLELQYDGTEFAGWAAQPGLRTVEGALRAALDRIHPTWNGLAVAGRTDAGVHALAQVASYATGDGPPPESVAAALNPLLPDDLVAVSSEAAPDDFHARFSAHARSYRYRIWRRTAPSPFERRRSLWWPRPLDEARLAESAALLVGEHDFRAFTPTETRHEAFRREVLAARWVEHGHDLHFEIEANSFLRHMVRTLVGTMVDHEPKHFGTLLDGADRSKAGRTAPPWGLYLERVSYPDASGV